MPSQQWRGPIETIPSTSLPLKIAQIAPLIESVPPRLYGGTERVVSYLTEELVAQGHDVTLFASGRSMTSAKLIPCCDLPLRQKGAPDPLPHYLAMLDKAHGMAAQFDILHFHIDQLQFPLFRDLASRTLTTLHGRQDLPDLEEFYTRFPQMPLVSISDAQRRPVPHANFIGTVPNGLPLDLFAPTLDPRGGYLAFLGRVSPEKGLDHAIAIASAVGLPLRIAAKIDRPDAEYFHNVIEPLLAPPMIDYVGEIDDRQKSRFLGEARALLFPIEWPEPFGVVMIEAMACGTPVLAFRRGSVPEVVDEDVTGCLVDTVSEAIAALGRVLALDRARVRRRFETRFSAARMARNYVALYRRLLGASGARPRAEQPILLASDRFPNRLEDGLERRLTHPARLSM
ncbi:MULTISPECIES: glycosyltransferase family 4 protein [Methylosinus]|uniref:Glycosyltransferase family 4 protein n=1 Tax=Methylosinus trichosporium (strain ATCC 35070 / NCIMB 11131 / UNIQEM 75 / OB3b) TaxID=595536 RepID=A0A2D2D4W0_METT3|nr:MULTISPECIES: glycosyltransferase family 4 protein [Methylosinus]ATQ69879.1 glycosyltransferase family 4 protein [Methylosinus trichosporium OB3b]OBS53905.1 glycosyl transferase [Methylosinus sp. 3S-1]